MVKKNKNYYTRAINEERAILIIGAFCSLNTSPKYESFARHIDQPKTHGAIFINQFFWTKV